MLSKMPTLPEVCAWEIRGVKMSCQRIESNNHVYIMNESLNSHEHTGS